MNWLAHVLLSEPDTDFRLGNLLADIVKGKARVGMTAGFLRGIECHRGIDRFTDYHPMVERSRTRIQPELRRYAGILVDIYYDHYLARDWPRFCPLPLDQFTAELYESFRFRPERLPHQACIVLDRIAAEDRLGSYREMAGIETALKRLSAYLSIRWSRPVPLERGMEDLLAHSDDFATDFGEFFPELMEHVRRLGYEVGSA